MDFREFYKTIHVRYPELEGKIAIVTGSSRGIGKGIAFRLAREGMKVVVTSRTESAVEQATIELESLGAQVCPVVADLSNDEGIELLFSRVIDRWKTVDVLVNNAADLRRHYMEDITPELVDYQLSANIRGPYLCSARASELMKQASGGSIIHISSVGGLRAHFRGLPYDISKGALDAMTRAMALDLCRYGIRVNAVAPGMTYNRGLMPDENTNKHPRIALIPANRIGTPQDIGSAVAFLASDDASYIIGQVLYVDGGITAMLGTPEQPL